MQFALVSSLALALATSAAAVVCDFSFFFMAYFNFNFNFNFSKKDCTSRCRSDFNRRSFPIHPCQYHRSERYCCYLQIRWKVRSHSPTFTTLPPFTRSSCSCSFFCNVFLISPGNHTVTQSTFSKPCEPEAGGFDSGWVFVPAGETDIPEWNLTITDDSKRPFQVFSIIYTILTAVYSYLVLLQAATTKSSLH